MYGLICKLNKNIFLKQNGNTRNNFGSRFPFKCYCLAAKSALQNSITTPIGAILPTSLRRGNFSNSIAIQLIIGLFLSMCWACKTPQTPKTSTNSRVYELKEATFKEMPYEQDEKFAYFKGTGEFKLYRKKIEYTSHGHPIGVYQYSSPKMDTLHGAWATFYPNGNISGSGYYIHGEKVGEWKTYFNVTEKNTAHYKSKESYFADKLQGEMTTYHENGLQSALYIYNDGLKDGLMQKWFENGNAYYEAEYKNGVMNFHTEWYANGNKKSYALLEHGKPIKAEFYSSKGLLTSEIKIVEDKYIKFEYDSLGNETKTTILEQDAH